MTVHIHLGAHKTASTHIQAILKKNAATLAEAKVTTVRPRDVRAAVGTVRERLKHPLLGALSGLAQRRAMKRLARLGRGADRLVAADETRWGYVPMSSHPVHFMLMQVHAAGYGPG